MAEPQTNVEELASKIKDKVKAVADEASQAAANALDDASGDAADAADAAVNVVDEAVDDGQEATPGKIRQFKARTRVQSAIDQAADRAHDLADWGIGATFDGVEQARLAYDRYSQETTRYIRRQPVKSVLLAAGVGAVLAGLLIGRASRRKDQR